MEFIMAFLSSRVFIIFSGITVIVVFLRFIYDFISWLRGVTPIFFRLGNALSKREIAIFASDVAFGDLRDALIDSKIFKGKNIVHIKDNNIDKARGKTIFLVDWETFGDKIDQVFSERKNHQTAIVIYAKPGNIPQEKMCDIAKSGKHCSC
ncbi:MAG: hypothetical protein HQL03_05365 [Nitrospirae bacterium]|nr:hypothetical protein [Nitrospirota bacterium]